MDRNKQTDACEEEINLLEYWNVAVRRRKLIFSVTAAVFVISIIISLLLPKYYAATASVLPPQQDDTLSSGVVSRLTGGIGSLGGFLGNSSADLWVGILKSQTVKDSIIDRFKLRELYSADTIEDAREKLEGHLSINKSKEEIISVTVEDKDPSRAAMMANAFIEELDRANRGSVMTSGQRTRAFLEKRLNDARDELEKIEGAHKSFQEKNKTIRIDEQSKAIIESAGSLKGQLMAKEVEIETLLSYATPSNHRVQLLKSEAAGLKLKLKELEQGKDGNRDIFVPTDRMPGLALQYARLLRDAKVQETLFEFLTQQYEMARIQEAKDSPTVQVLDTAKAPEKKSRPKRAIIVIVMTFAGAFFSTALAFWLEYRDNSMERA